MWASSPGSSIYPESTTAAGVAMKTAAGGACDPQQSSNSLGQQPTNHCSHAPHNDVDPVDAQGKSLGVSGTLNALSPDQNAQV